MILFISNFVSPHTIPLSKALYELLSGDFLFIETQKMPTERKSLGYDKFENLEFVVPYERYNNNISCFSQLIDSADVVLASLGSIDASLLSRRIENNKLTFLMSERIFKKGFLKIFHYKFWQLLFLLFHVIRKSNVHLLCMGAYVARDFTLCGFPKERMWKFGYLTESPHHEKKCENIGPDKIVHMLWVGRLIWWKKPFHAIKSVHNLKTAGYKVDLNIVGGGKLEKKVRKYVEKFDMEEIHFHGILDNFKVQELMSISDVLLCTSNRLEGWGAVINEGMNAGCLVVANEKMGAAPFLIRNGETGYLYSGGAKELELTLRKMISDGKMKTVSRNGFSYITEYWSSKPVAKMFLDLVEKIKKSECPSFNDGPCGRAI